MTVPHGRLVTSFSSKSELALNLSTDGSSLTFMGYVAKPGAVDVSNSNTPGVIDPTNPVPSAFYRVVAQMSANGQLSSRDQRLQRQQRPRRDHRREGQQAAHLHVGQRRERRQPAAERRHPRRGRTADHRPGASPGHAHAGRQLQHHPAGRPGGQDRQGRQLPRPDDLQQRPVLHQGQRRQRRQHRVLPGHHREGVPERGRPAAAGGEAAHLAAQPTTRRPCRPPGCRATCAS